MNLGAPVQPRTGSKCMTGWPGVARAHPRGRLLLGPQPLLVRWGLLPWPPTSCTLGQCVGGGFQGQRQRWAEAGCWAGAGPGADAGRGAGGGGRAQAGPQLEASGSRCGRGRPRNEAATPTSRAGTCLRHPGGGAVDEVDKWPPWLGAPLLGLGWTVGTGSQVSKDTVGTGLLRGGSNTTGAGVGAARWGGQG